MSSYRQIHTHIWKDAWFLGLTPPEKLLFVYLFSNERASICGLYELSMRVICFETGLTPSRAETVMEKFQADRKVFYDNGLVWVVNLRKYNENSSPKVRTKVMNDLALIVDCPLKKRYLVYHTTGNTISHITDTISETESEQEQEQEQDKEQEQEGGAKARPARKVKVEYPAVEAFRTAAGIYPNKTLWQSMDEAIGSKLDDLTFWQQVVTAWVAKGWNPRNIQGMFDFYKRRELPANGNGRTPKVEHFIDYQ